MADGGRLDACQSYNILCQRARELRRSSALVLFGRRAPVSGSAQWGAGVSSGVGRMRNGRWRSEPLSAALFSAGHGDQRFCGALLGIVVVAGY